MHLHFKKNNFMIFLYLNPFQLTSHFCFGPTDWRTTTTQLNRSVIKFSIVFACRFIHKANYKHCKATSEHQRSEKECELILRALAVVRFFWFPILKCAIDFIAEWKCVLRWMSGFGKSEFLHIQWTFVKHTHFN